METHTEFRQLTGSKDLILALALCSSPKGKAVHNSPNFKPKFGGYLRAKMDKNHFQEIKQHFSE